MSEKYKKFDHSSSQVEDESKAYKMAYAEKGPRERAAKSRKVADKLLAEIIEVQLDANRKYPNNDDSLWDFNLKERADHMYPVSDIVEDEYGYIDEVPFNYHPAVDVYSKPSAHFAKIRLPKPGHRRETTHYYQYGTEKVMKSARVYATKQDKIAAKRSDEAGKLYDRQK